MLPLRSVGRSNFVMVCVNKFNNVDSKATYYENCCVTHIYIYIYKVCFVLCSPVLFVERVILHHLCCFVNKLLIKTACCQNTEMVLHLMVFSYIYNFHES